MKYEYPRYNPSNYLYKPTHQNPLLHDYNNIKRYY